MSIAIYTLYNFVPHAPLRNEIFVPFLTGVRNAPLGFLSDERVSVPPIDDCCELAYYSVWQRLRGLGLCDADHVGFQQYRRMFFFNVGSAVKDFHATSQSFFTVNADEFRQYRCDLQDAPPKPIADFVAAHDIITTRAWPLDSVRSHFVSSHGEPAWDALARAVGRMGYDVTHEREFHPCCLFIMRVPIFRRYMEDWWKFITLYEMAAVGELGHTERIFGYALERFWSMWYRKHKANYVCAEIPFVFGNAKGVDL